MKFQNLILVAILCTGSSLTAEDWTSWRGSNGNSLAEGAGYPTKWSADSGIVWKAEIPGVGASSPVVSRGHVFLTSTLDNKNQVSCLTMEGKVKWTKTLGKSIEGKRGKDGTGANPSAVTDGEHVFVYFKSGDFACFDFAGTLKWETNVFQRFAEVTSETLWWDLGTSPVLTSDAVVIAMMHSGPSYLAAFRPSDGELLWKQDRQTDAPREAAQSYTTPVVTTNPNGLEIIVVTGADYVTGHEASNGKELWRVGSLNPKSNEYFRSISSSVSDGNVVVAPYARGDSLTTIQLGKLADGQARITWDKTKTSADVPTPVIQGDRVFVLRDVKKARGTVDCINLKTGDTIWSGQLPAHRTTYRASPVYADGHLYATRQDGTVFVLDATADDFKLVSENKIADAHTVSTPAFVDGKILLRSGETLYCIGK